jgi:hypothetical protein
MDLASLLNEPPPPSSSQRHLSGDAFSCAQPFLLRPNVNALSVEPPPALLVVRALFSMLTDDFRV